MTPARIRPAPLIDWNQVMLGLRAEGYSLNDLATLTGIPRSTLTSWQSGCSPNHQDGETLIAFWCESTQRPRESLPINKAGNTRIYGVRR